VSDASLLRILGERLRRARESRGWSLGDVESRSHGRFKAGIVGCYERGDRTVSVPRLVEIAELYDIPASTLLDGTPRAAGPAPLLVVDLAALGSAPVSDRAAMVLGNYVAAIRNDRRGRATDRIVLRTEDLRAMSAVLGADRMGLVRRWRDLGLLIEDTVAPEQQRGVRR